MGKSFLKRCIDKVFSNEFFINRSILAALIFLACLSLVVIYDNPTVFSFLLLCFCLFLLFQTYINNKIYQAAAGLKVADIMIPRASLFNFTHSTPTLKALDVVCKSYQTIFPVLYNEDLLGIINKDRFMAAISVGHSESYLADYIEKKFDYVYNDVEVKKLLSNGRLKAAKTMIVFDKNNNFLGLLAFDKLIEFLLLDKALKESKNTEAHDEFFL